MMPRQLMELSAWLDTISEISPNVHSLNESNNMVRTMVESFPIRAVTCTISCLIQVPTSQFFQRP